ncbi:hypothetical protein MIB92_13195 [Aestuariirhabdus sp. Z084]|uniref:hypothetical protein n=1 Tax=Aestuariirhabdus haliotis TaxID=2918751 RepID=UPI00201B3E7C|nr:hypothetical protein [Aestuariirhabdus haliotis]MCL6416609.1 hypothetical protein [Aestuariirhabdus haliotis]MCL6420644.1 hypothetical protein [Aestuariirhabdus haliotis]
MRYQCYCKATNRESKEPRYSHNWVSAKRARFKVFDDRIECGNWTIAYSEIQAAHLYRAKQLFIPVNVLQLVTGSGSFQFGFNPWANPFRHLGVEYSETQIALGHSPYSISIRILLLTCLGYLAGQHMGIW